MQVFKIRKDGFKEIRKRMLQRSVPLLVIAVAVGITISTLNSKQQEDEINTLPILIPFVAIVLVFGVYRGINRQRELFESYTLTITSNLITREQLNTPTISIYFNDVKEVTKGKNGGFAIKGREAAHLIGIPAQIDNHAELEALLQQIQPIAIRDKVPFIEKYQGLTGIISVALVLCVYNVSNKIIVALTGTVLITLMVWSLVKIRNSKNIDSKTKRSVWWVLLVLASVIFTIIHKLNL